MEQFPFKTEETKEGLAEKAALLFDLISRALYASKFSEKDG